jgi:hypothetical protein
MIQGRFGIFSRIRPRSPRRWSPYKQWLGGEGGKGYEVRVLSNTLGAAAAQRSRPRDELPLVRAPRPLASPSERRLTGRALQCDAFRQSARTSCEPRMSVA